MAAAAQTHGWFLRHDVYCHSPMNKKSMQPRNSPHTLQGRAFGREWGEVCKHRGRKHWGHVIQSSLWRQAQPAAGGNSTFGAWSKFYPTLRRTCGRACIQRRAPSCRSPGGSGPQRSGRAPTHAPSSSRGAEGAGSIGERGATRVKFKLKRLVVCA